MKSGRWIVCLLGMLWGVCLASVSVQAAPNPSDSVVEISVDAATYQQTSPWNTDMQQRIGTGFIISVGGKKRILTTARLVQDAVYVTIRSSRSSKHMDAEVEQVSTEVDLAILKLKDQGFFQHRDALPLGDLPKPAQKVTLYGYPLGGEGLSITEGIISRIEYQPYDYSGLTFQAIQVDARTYAGSSGGPALVDGKVVGMVFMLMEEAKNISYLVPAPRIRQLLDDLQDGTLDGVPELWLDYQFILNPAQKNYLRLTPQQTGILVNNLCAHTDAALVLNKGDVITAVDGEPVTEDGFVENNGKQYSNFKNRIDLHQVDDIVTLDILSNGSRFKRNLRLNKRSQTSKVLESKPRYFIFGGFVFLASRSVPACEPVGDDDTGESEEGRDSVNLVEVLPTSSGNIGFHDAAPMLISTVNGQTFDTFEDFYHLVKQGKEKNIVLEDAGGYQVVINRHLAETEQAGLLKEYNISKPESDDLEDGEDE